MSNLRPAEVVRLGSKEPTNIRLYHDTHLIFYKDKLSSQNKDNAVYQHLYVLSDERPKVGEWYLVKVNYGSGGVYVPESLGRLREGEEDLVDKYQPKKIIASTNTKLGIQNEDNILKEEGDYISPITGLPDKFLKEYCDKGGIDKIMVEYEMDKINVGLNNDVLYIPKISSNNTIIIKPIKNNWSREEILQIIADVESKLLGEVGNDYEYNGVRHYTKLLSDEF